MQRKVAKEIITTLRNAGVIDDAPLGNITNGRGSANMDHTAAISNASAPAPAHGVENNAEEAQDDTPTP